MSRAVGAKRTLYRLLPVIGLIAFAQWLGYYHGSNDSWMSIGVTACWMAIAAVGVNVLLGYTGLLSLGHAGFLVAGGYAGAVFAPAALASDSMPGFVAANAGWFGIPFAFLFGGLLGAVLALMCCHLRGFYLTVVTLAFGALLPAIVIVLSSQLGGTSGRALEHPVDTTNVPGSGGAFRAGLFYVALVLLLVSLYMVKNLVRTRWGRAFMAIRESEIAARASGVNTYWYKVASFALSAGIVAIGGWVFAQNLLTVSASDIQNTSFRFIIYCVLGGMGTMAGPVLGAFGIEFLLGLSWVQETFRNYLGLMFGVLGIVGVATAPEGIVGNLRKAVRRVQLARARKGVELRQLPIPDAGDLDVEARPAARHHEGLDAPVLVVDGLTKRFGGLTALGDLSLTVERGSIHALIGPNGSGKSTFVNVITGLYDVTAGRITFNGEIINDLPPFRRNKIGIARTFQNLQVWRRMSVVENVMVGMHAETGVGLSRSLLGTPGSYREERIIRRRAWGLLHFVGLAEKGWAMAGSLAFADQRRLEIARALASDPDLLLLDEPAAGMHPSEIRHLVELIAKVRDSGVTVLLIEHHMDVVMGLSDRVSVLDYGQKIAEGRPEEVQRDERVIEAYLGAGAEV